MTDTTTKKPIRVSTAGTAGPYVTVPVAQLDAIRPFLDNEKIRYWVDEFAISIEGAPETTVINFGRGTDPKTVFAVQVILDSLP